MKEKPGIGASPSLPFTMLGESQGYDSEPQTASKRHRNGTPQHNTAGSVWVILAPIWAGARPLDKRLTMWYTTRVEFNDTRLQQHCSRKTTE